MNVLLQFGGIWLAKDIASLENPDRREKIKLEREAGMAEERLRQVDMLSQEFFQVCPELRVRAPKHPLMFRKIFHYPSLVSLLPALVFVMLLWFAALSPVLLSSQDANATLASLLFRLLKTRHHLSL